MHENWCSAKVATYNHMLPCSSKAIDTRQGCAHWQWWHRWCPGCSCHPGVSGRELSILLLEKVVHTIPGRLERLARIVSGAAEDTALTCTFYGEDRQTILTNVQWKGQEMAVTDWKLWLGIRKTLFTRRVLKHRNRLLRAIMDCSSLGAFKTWLNEILSNVV